jgi:hypothetical protein
VTSCATSAEVKRPFLSSACLLEVLRSRLLDDEDGARYGSIMDDVGSNDYDPKLRSRFLIWIAIVLLVIYPLSLGPAVLLLHRTSPESIQVIYAPLGYLHQHVPIARVMLDGYLRLWGVP